MMKNAAIPAAVTASITDGIRASMQFNWGIASPTAGPSIPTRRTKPVTNGFRKRRNTGAVGWLRRFDGKNYHDAASI